MARQTIFITGAAAGIGRAIAQRFAQAGWYVGAFDIDTLGVQKLREELGNERCHAGTLDVTDHAAWQSALDAFVSAAGQDLTALVNNAGILDSGPFQDIDAASHKRIVDINISGVMNGCHAGFALLKGRPNACIINMASASAIYGQPSLASYAASKFAVRGLTEGLNIEWKPHGIRVVDIWPLFVKTRMVEGMKADSVQRMGVKLMPEDVANVVLKAAQASPSSQRVHWNVGLETGAFAMLARLAPNALTRLIVKHLAS